MPCIWPPHLLCSNTVQIIDFTLIVYHSCRFETKAAAAARQPKKKQHGRQSRKAMTYYSRAKNSTYEPHAICQELLATTVSSAILENVHRRLGVLSRFGNMSVVSEMS